MQDTRQLYLDLLKKCLMHTLYEELDMAEWMPSRSFRDRLLGMLLPSEARLFLPAVDATRQTGNEWPMLAQTMIGAKRLDNIQYCMETVLREAVPGDVIEAGVWRGGACIFMRGLLAVWEVQNRTVFVADSFAGLPPPCADLYPADAWSDLHELQGLAVSVDQVRANFERYGLLDDQVKFIAGWFRDSLPTAPLTTLAVARLDGDLYESIMDSLTHLYPKLSPGGFLIVDDYLLLACCKQAVDDYRAAHGIHEEIRAIDWNAVYWRKEG